VNILILGGTGFIGSNLLERLDGSDHKIKVLLRNHNKDIKPYSNVEYFYSEYSKIEEVPNLFNNVELVVNLITTTYPTTSNSDMVYDINSNLINAVKLLDLMKHHKINKSIFISSGGSVYGNTSKQFVNEEDPLNPISSYSIVKVAIESYLRLYHHLYGIEYTILRASNPYGKQQSKIGIQGIIPTIFDRIMNDNPLEIWGDGSVIRDYIYIDDLIDAIVVSIEQNIFGTYNIGSGIGSSILEVVETIEEITKKKCNIKFYPERKFDVKRVVLDTNKFKDVSEWIPKTSLKSGCEKYFELLKN
jgi:UDP-glucose 4-epimerase